MEYLSRESNGPQVIGPRKVQESTKEAVNRSKYKCRRSYIHLRKNQLVIPIPRERKLNLKVFRVKIFCRISQIQTKLFLPTKLELEIKLKNTCTNFFSSGFVKFTLKFDQVIHVLFFLKLAVIQIVRMFYQ